MLEFSVPSPVLFFKDRGFYTHIDRLFHTVVPPPNIKGASLMPTPLNEHLPWHTKFLYGISDFGFACTDTTMQVLFAIFMTDVVGLKPAYAALAIFIGRTWDYINDPLIGFFSDRVRTRWGRRRPFLLFGAIPFGLMFAMMWYRPPTEDQFLLAAYYALAYFLFDSSYTFVTMPYSALTPELTQDYDERTSLTSYRMAFSIIGSLVAFIVPLMIIGSMRPENSGRVFSMGLIFGTACALPLIFTFLGTRERPEYYSQSQPSLRESIKAVWNNKPFLFAAGIFLFTWTAADIIQAFLLFFLKYRMNMEGQSDIILGAIFITALLVLPFWNWISLKTDKRKAYIIGMVFLSVIMIALIFISPSLGMPIVLLMSVLAGIGVSAIHVLTWAIIPDAVEVDELATGKRHEGIFYSLVSLFKKIASSIAIPLTLLVLDWSGYVSNATVQKPSAILAIRILTGPVPSLFLLGGILFAIFYPLSRETHNSTREKIQRKIISG
jgi:glycoside/pentoside/hexuronide:cation symporter, GPH family